MGGSVADLPALITSGQYYSRYKGLNQSFQSDTFRCAEDTVAELLKTATTSEHPGMLLGKVQSGKTRTFISVLALAFDNGYDLAVVLSKNSKALIEQTLKRLRSEFKVFIDDEELEVYDIMHAPESFNGFELQSKLIFVAKKQSDNLRRLVDLFNSNPAMAAKRTIIIDDEADNASIGYVKKAGLLEARTIAVQVSELRTAIKSSSFLQVTATPYSLYLQPNEIEVTNVVSFKPTRPAFTKLVPVPNEYVGGDTYFGELASDHHDTLESLIHHTVEHREFDRLKREDGRTLKLADVLSSKAIKGFRSAIVNFIVGGCIQILNGQAAGKNIKKLKYSFLVHSEPGREAHEWQERLTRTIVERLTAAAEDNRAEFDELIGAAYRDLSKSVALANQPVPGEQEVKQLVLNTLRQRNITVAKINSDEDVASLLDESGQLRLRNPFNIFVGGQVLDRGVTLAGLIGFYYGRRPSKFQQDTVLQHSRMYGYRRADLGVTRFYTSVLIRDAMTQMEDFDATLRRAIEAGGDRAVQFIRKANDGSIVPCSPNKILVATTKTLRPLKRILPIGFQTRYAGGAHGIADQIERIDTRVRDLCGFEAQEPRPISIETAVSLLNDIEKTLVFDDDEAPEFDWDGARAALAHLSQQHPNAGERGKVLLWAANKRQSARMAAESSHATYIETPDSTKTEGVIARRYAKAHPILFLLRQEGTEQQGWRGTPFYWPVIQAQVDAATAIYTAETID